MIFKSFATQKRGLFFADGSSVTRMYGKSATREFFLPCCPLWPWGTGSGWGWWGFSQNFGDSDRRSSFTHTGKPFLALRWRGCLAASPEVSMSFVHSDSGSGGPRSRSFAPLWFFWERGAGRGCGQFRLSAPGCNPPMQLGSPFRDSGIENPDRKKSSPGYRSFRPPRSRGRPSVALRQSTGPLH